MSSKGVLVDLVKYMKRSFIGLSFVLASSSVNTVMPQDLLQDGVDGKTFDSGLYVRKGTVAAALTNAFLFDQLITEQDSEEKSTKIASVIIDLKSLVSGLDALKMFELFSPDEWIKWVPGKEGRILIGLLYLQENPESSNAKIIAALRSDYKSASAVLQKEVSKTLEKLDISN